MTRTIRVALIGANWGLIHVDAWKAVPGVDVAAICTAHRETAEAAAKQYDIPRAFWDTRALIADPGIDVIDISVRPSVREPLALETLEAGKHLLQTIPFALSLEKGRVLRSRAAASGRIAMVETLHRHEPAFRQFRDMIQSGAIGKVHSVRGHVRTGIVLSPPPGWPYQWITDPASGASALRNFGAHLLHTMVWIFGPVVSVAARLATNLPTLTFTDGSTAPNGTVDNADLLVRFAGGPEGTVDASWCTPGSEGFAIDAVGDHGRLRIRADNLGPDHSRIERSSPSGEAALAPVAVEPRYTLFPEAPDIRPRPGNPRFVSLATMCHRLATAARGESADAGPDFDEAFHVMNVVEAAYHAHAARRWIDVPDIEPAG